MARKRKNAGSRRMWDHATDVVYILAMARAVNAGQAVRGSFTDAGYQGIYESVKFARPDLVSLTILKSRKRFGKVRKRSFII